MTERSAALTLLALGGMPLVDPGDNLAELILLALDREGVRLDDGDIVVIAQKIVSKAEGRLIKLSTVSPSPRAEEIAARSDKDPRLIELILGESQEVMRIRKGAIIVRHKSGVVLANAGIDQSNVEHGEDRLALLLPVDPDASARRIRETLRARSGADVAVLIIDSLGRAWRTGTTGAAIGIAGMPGMIDLRGQPDLHGRRLESSELGFADEVAAAASLIMGQADEGRPVVLVRGLDHDRREGHSAELIRPRHMDLFP